MHPTNQAPAFHNGVIVGNVTSGKILEASGLAASRRHPGYLYTHNDGQAPARGVFILSATSGQVVATLTITGATAHDWEDMAVAPCRPGGGGESCIYIGDMGDRENAPVNNIYRFPEPDTIQDQTIDVKAADKLEFSWGESDCETLMVDPDANVYLVSKANYTNAQGLIVQLPNGAWGTNTRVAVTSSSRVPINSTNEGPMGGDISPDGKEVILKIKEQVLYWNNPSGRDYTQLLTSPGTPLPYTQEPNGQALCWDATGSGYYTLSEGSNQPLYRYTRDTPAPAVGR